MEKLWILEDHLEVLSILEHLAQSYGYEVFACSSLKAAWEAFVRARSDPQFAPDFVISDFHLGDGTSENWMTSIRILFPKAKVICFSGMISSEIVERLQKMSIQSFFKPESLGDVIHLMKEIKMLSRKN